MPRGCALGCKKCIEFLSDDNSYVRVTVLDRNCHRVAFQLMTALRPQISHFSGLSVPECSPLPSLLSHNRIVQAVMG